ncbi:MAG: glycosyltransferase [Crocinitomicaceae bacterium]|nr:glycosyltransferase [Crocinitomicaceae bacterium]
MKVSIITIAYNSEGTIEDTIKSVIAQDYSNIEYIIIDGASKDATMEIVDKYKDQIAIVVSEPDKGIYDAMNKGVQRATGDLVGILNSDDIYADNQVISKVVSKIKEDNSDALYADLVYVDRDDTNKVTRKWISGAYKEGKFKKGWMPPHPTFFIKKEWYDQFGSYSTELKISADYECMLRMVHKNKAKLSYLNEIITKMRVGGESNVSIKNRLKANKEDRMAWKMNGLKAGTFTSIRKPLSKVGQFLKK